MEEDRLTLAGRRSRRNAQKKGPSKKIYIPVLVVILLLLGGGGYFAYTVHHKDQLDEASFKDSEQALLKKIQEQQKQEGPESKETTSQDGSLETLLFTPVNNTALDKQQQIQEQLQTLVQQEKAKRTTDSPTKLVARFKKILLSKSLTQFQPLVDSYTWDDETQQWSLQTTSGDHSFLINQTTQQPLELKDIFVNEVNLLAIQQVIQQKLLSEHSDDKDAIDKVLALPKLQLDKTSFTYYPDKITLSLPENKLEAKEVTLTYKEIAGYINPDYVDAAAIKDALPAPLDPNKKYISLTFDDGPNPATTPQLLDILKEKNVKATFFMLGQNVTANEALAKRVNDEGHEVASHSYSHPQLTTCSPETVKSEVQKTDKAIYQAIGKLPLDFRPPYGAVNTASAAIINKPIIEWSVDSQDWKSKNTAAIIQRVRETAYNDSIVLMHDIHPETVAAVPAIIDQLRADGYEIIPVRQLLGNKAKPMHMYYGSKDERPVQ